MNIKVEGILVGMKRKRRIKNEEGKKTMDQRK
jgi:hypothetical protein